MPKLILIKHSMPELDATVPAPQWHLSELGRARSELLANKLSEYSLDVIVSSVEPKAIETAQIVARRLGKPCEVAEDLHEHERNRVAFGNAEQFEKSVAEFFANPSKLVFGEETADAAHARFSNAVSSVIEKHSRRNLAIIAHGTVITLYVSRLINVALFEFWKRLGLPSFVVLNVIASPEGAKQSPSRDTEIATAQKARLATLAPHASAGVTLEKVVENVE